MVPGFHILYSAHFLTHRQHCSTTVLDGNIDMSAYTPKHLFHNFAKTYQRLTCDADDNISSDFSSDEAISEDCSSRDECSTSFDNNVHNELLAFWAFLTGYGSGREEERNYFALLKEYEEKQRY